VKRLGRAASELLAAELPKEVLSLYWAKNMYWRAGKQERFVRRCGGLWRCLTRRLSR